MYTPSALLSQLFLQICRFILSLYITNNSKCATMKNSSSYKGTAPINYLT